MLLNIPKVILPEFVKDVTCYTVLSILLFVDVDTDCWYINIPMHLTEFVKDVTCYTPLCYQLCYLLMLIQIVDTSTFQCTSPLRAAS